MKLRIRGNSLRLRVTRSEVERLVNAERIEETIHFSPDMESRWTYALEHSHNVHEVTIRFRTAEIVIVLPAIEAQQWSTTDQVGIYATIDLGPQGSLALSIEKDFACLDLRDEDNFDTFPNPKA